MKRTLAFVALVLGFAYAGTAQMIQNGGFELGTKLVPNDYGSTQYANIPGWYNGDCEGIGETPDLATTAADPTHPYVGVPGCGIYPRDNGQVNNRFARISSRESICASFTEPLTSTSAYKISCYAGRVDWAPTLSGNQLTNYESLDYPIEFVLMKSTDCSVEKVVYRLADFEERNNCGTNKTSIWDEVTGSFTLTPQEVAIGFDRIEIRIGVRSNGEYLNGPFYCLFIDDVTMVKIPKPIADYNFVTLGQTYEMVNTPYGQVQLTQVCASPAPAKTPVMINGSASQNETGYGISIQPWNPANWSPAGPAIYNAWISGTAQVPTTDININNLPGVNMTPGQIYRVVLYVGIPYHEKDGLFRINVLPTINAGADQTLCNGLAASVNVTTSHWPVKVYKSGVLVGTYNSNPISLSPTTTSTYTFKTTAPGGCSAQDDMTITVNTCSLASFVFKNPIGSEQITSTQWGPQTVSHLCSPYKIDGSASVNENAYYFHIQRFDIENWAYLDFPLYNNWYATGQVGSDISLHTVVQSVGNNFTYGHIYAVGLAVGPQWHSVTKFFKAINCTKNGEVAFEEVSLESEVLVFPNPTSGAFTVMLDGVAAEQVMVTNVLGEIVFNSAIPEEVQSMDINLSELPAGVYMVHVKQANGETILKKIVKS